jgi:hypothetical protein
VKTRIRVYPTRSVQMRNACLLITMIFFLSLFVVTLSYSLPENLELSGDVRLRLRLVDSARKSPVFGTYGESLNRGFAQRHRFVLEASYPISTAITVGGKVRVSNEDEDILRSGPEYLSSKFGSAFVKYETPALRTRFGYYDIDYTPLSLMRWDVEDDPEGGGGGCAVCPGTPGVAGTILGESLEELGPVLTFEGLRLDLSPWDAVGCNGFFAISTVAGETYDVLTYGGRFKFTRYLEHSSSLMDISLMAIRSEEDERSKERDLISKPKPFSNTVLGVAWKVPVVGWLDFQGEWTYSDSRDQTDRRPEISGNGAIASVTAKIYGGIRAEASYIYLSPNWDSYFRALSYSYNRRGPRIRLEYEKGNLLIALFSKYLTTIDPVNFYYGEPAVKMAYPTVSARGYLTAAPDLNLGLAVILSGEGPEDDGVTLDTDNRRTTVLGTVTYEFGKSSSVTLEERYVRHRFEELDDYNVSMVSLYVRAAIW